MSVGAGHIRYFELTDVKHVNLSIDVDGFRLMLR